MTRPTLLILLLIAGILILLRVLLMGYLPLMDTTEARYAEIARIMFETGDWVTPWFTSSTPFWGKPPLSFWATAISFNAFGISELSARIPHFICSLLVLILVWRWTREYSLRIRIYSIVILSSSSLFYIGSGMVMTDIWLLLSTTLVLYGFWGVAFGSDGSTRINSSIMFFGFGLGMLAKGPVVIVLTVMPVFLWVVIARRWLVLKKIYWLEGVVLASVICLPWYILAEIKTPGFLEYFILGEHVYRFVVPGWEGDLYGNAHDEHYGTIWLFLISGLFPWSLLLLPALVYLVYSKNIYAPRSGDHKRILLILWVASPCIFFTFAGNVLWPYVITALPAAALIISLVISSITIRKINRDVLVVSTLSVTVIAYATSSYLFVHSGTPEKRSQKFLVSAYQARCDQDERLKYINGIPFSAKFYSKGKVNESTFFEGYNIVDISPGSCVAIRDNGKLNETIKNSTDSIGRFGQYTLYKIVRTHDLVADNRYSHLAKDTPIND